MPKVAKPLPVLTDDQKALIEGRYFEPPDVLLRLVFPDQPTLDLRSVHWKSIRAHLAIIGHDPGHPGSGPQPKSASPATSAPRVTELTSAQIEFIEASYKDANGPVELARTLFNDPRIMPGDHRVRLITTHLRRVDPTYRKEDEEVEELDYQPPRTTTVLAGRLNRYGIGERPDGKKLLDGAPSGQEQRQLEALLRHMRTPVFKVEADKFSKKIDREVFESVFLATCWDKPDLTPEHVLQYIQLASLSAQRNIADRLVRVLDERFALSLETPEARLSKSEVDALGQTKDKATEHLKQINALIKTLVVERKKLDDEKVAGSSSMHPLVASWKTKEGRARQMAVASRYNDELKAEVKNLAGMDALKCEIFGLNPETIAL